MPAVTAPAFDPIYQVLEAEICNKALSRLSADVIKNTEEDTKQSRACRVVYAQTRDELLRMYPFNFATKTALVPEDTDYPFPMDEYAYAHKAEDYESFTGTGVLGASVITAITGIVVDSRLIGRVITGAGVQAGARVESVVTTVGAETITLDRPFTAAAAAFVVHIPALKFMEIERNDNNIFELVGGGESKRIFSNIRGQYDDEALEYKLEVKYIEQVIDPSKFDSMFLDALALRIASKICVQMTSNASLAQILQQEFASIMQLAQNTSGQERQLDSPDAFWSERAGQQSVQTRR